MAGKTTPEVQPTGARLETSKTDHDRIGELLAENAQLREELAAVKSGQPVKRPVPTEPSFGISEGVRDDLERNGTTTSPFTGKTLTRDDLPDAPRPAAPDDDE